MAGHSVNAFERWGSRRSSPRRDLRGRTRTLSVLSVRSAESVWITSSSSAGAICSVFYRTIFSTITTPEHIFRSAKSARGFVPYNFPRPAISLLSQKLAACTIAMNVGPRRSARRMLLAPAFNRAKLDFEQAQVKSNEQQPVYAPEDYPLRAITPHNVQLMS